MATCGLCGADDQPLTFIGHSAGAICMDGDACNERIAAAPEPLTADIDGFAPEHEHKPPPWYPHEHDGLPRHYHHHFDVYTRRAKGDA